MLLLVWSLFWIVLSLLCFISLYFKSIMWLVCTQPLLSPSPLVVKEISLIFFIYLWYMLQSLTFSDTCFPFHLCMIQFHCEALCPGKDVHWAFNGFKHISRILHYSLVGSACNDLERLVVLCCYCLFPSPRPQSKRPERNTLWFRVRGNLLPLHEQFVG